MSVHTKGYLIDSRSSVKGELVEINGLVYSCTLNQTELDANKNKFYIMQLIKNSSTYTLFSVWGRIGNDGQTSQKNFSSESEGANAFKKQFSAKTGNTWGIDKFVKKEGKYFMSDVSYEDELKEAKIDDIKIKVPDSVLPERTQKLISMLTDVNMMQNSLISLDIDVKKLPLGKIKQSQLKLAEEILDKIQPIITELKTKINNTDLLNSLTKLSNEYYTYVPKNVGYKRLPVIDTDELVHKYKDTLEELKNIAVTVKLQEGVKADENPIDKIYEGINTVITPLEKTSNQWKILSDYISTTHGETHQIKLEIIDIFKIEQNGRKEMFDKVSSKIDNHTMLFHGSATSNLISILTHNFYLDPAAVNSNIVISGYMFSKGIYMASNSTKSAYYCRMESTNNIGTLIMCEAALGTPYQQINANYSITKDSLAKINCHSTWGVGQYQPSKEVLMDGIKVPMGPLKKKNPKNTLYYNEHIVYDVNQVLIRYLIVVKNVGGISNY